MITLVNFLLFRCQVTKHHRDRSLVELCTKSEPWLALLLWRRMQQHSYRSSPCRIFRFLSTISSSFWIKITILKYCNLLGSTIYWQWVSTLHAITVDNRVNTVIDVAYRKLGFNTYTTQILWLNVWRSFRDKHPSTT